MNGNPRRAVRGAGLALGVALIAAAATPAPASHLQTLYRFHGLADGMFPAAAPIVGPHGELYGMTLNGGDPACSVGGTSIGCGVVYRLTPPSTAGGKWTETVLHRFTGGRDGVSVFQSPSYVGLTLGEDGTLYGVTQNGGGVICSLPGADNEDGCGTAFALTPPSSGSGAWTEKILHRFGRPGDGFLPMSALLPGGDGVLYGATAYGGDANCAPQGGFSSTCGTIYQLTPPKTKGGNWAEKLIYVFTDPATMRPEADLTFYRGVMYGTTYMGTKTSGGVFSLSPPAGGGSKWSYQALQDFPCPGTGPGNPLGGLIVSSGAVYGTTSMFTNCRATENGTVFALTRPAKPGGSWPLEILHTFGGATAKDGSGPVGGLVAAKGGLLFGATSSGGSKPCALFSDGCGTVWQLAPPAAAGGPWQETILYNFQGGQDGAGPVAVSAGGPGVLYGATAAAGDSRCFSGSGCGTVFKLVH